MHLSTKKIVIKHISRAYVFYRIYFKLRKGQVQKMNIETNLSGVKISETLALCGSEVLAETDIILSETYPDILRILQVDGNAVIREKEVSKGRVILRGDIALNIIYVPDPGMSDMPAKSITATAPFTDVCQASDVLSDMKIHSRAEIVNIECSLINSRKINIKAAVSTEIKAVRQSETEFISGAESEDGSLQILQKEVRALRQEADEDFVITVSDKIEIPSGKPSAADILKITADISGADVRLIAGKAIIKGAVNVGTLYVGRKNLSLEFMEHEIPFTEILELSGVTEDMDADIDFSVQNIYYETDDAEEMRTIGVEITLLANANVTNSESAVILADCYSSESEISVTKRNCEIDYLSGLIKPQINVRGEIALGGENPFAERVLSVQAKPVLDKVSVNGENVTLQGRLLTDVLYLTNEEEMPLSGARGEIPFDFTAEADGESTSAECAMTLSNLSYTLSEDAVNIRATLSAAIKLIGKEKVSVIEEIKISDAEKPFRAPIVIYFVQSGDTLWNIAKKYRTTASKIAAANNMDMEKTLMVGEKLLIP